MSSLIVAFFPFILVGSVIAWAVVTYNRFVRYQLEVDNGWASIDVQLKRRRDLIPNLVETAKGYMTHERDTLTRIAELRAKVAHAPAGPGTMAMENELGRMIGSLLAVVENYPELKANQNFMSLQEELASTENRIGFARQYYNEMVKRYNTAIRLFPAAVIAQMLRLGPREMWDLGDREDEREPVAVKFN